MTDREWLELAAKAAGHEFGEINGVFKARIEHDIGTCGAYGCTQHQWRDWNPLTDDADAFRLAVQCEMDVFVRAGRWTEAVCPMCPAVKEPHNGDPCAATRRAIVRAAAEIGRGMA